MHVNWKRFVPDIRSLDPDDARRRSLLNILLAGAVGITALVLVASTGLLVAGAKWADLWMVFAASLAFLIFTGGVFALNRRGPGWLASLLFLLLMVASFTFGDTPAEVVAGRTLFLFTAPIIMASVLLRPWASFALAGICGAAITALAVVTTPAALSTLPTSLGLFLLLALISWLAARSLEKALLDLRTLNRELDQRVQQRTAELTSSNARLAESLSENTAILNSIADGVIVLDHHGQAVVANPSMEVYLGRSVAEILQQDMATLMRTGVEAAQSDLLLGLLRETGTAHPNIRLQWGSRTLSVSLAPVQAEGQLTGTVAVFRDFTKEAEVERLKSMFVSMITHELRSPLGATSSFVDMLLSNVWGELANDQQRDVMKRIRSNTKQLLSLIGDLLDRARLEAGKLALNPVRFSPATPIWAGSAAKLFCGR